MVTMNKKLGLIACATALQFLHAGVQAGVIISIQETGSGVFATGSGSLDLAGLRHSAPGEFLASSYISPIAGAVIIGIGPSRPLIELYGALISGPADFGSGGPFAASDGRGPPSPMLAASPAVA